VLIGSFMFALAKSARADRNLVDLDLIGALTALAKSYDTRVNAGLYYDPPLTSGIQQSIIAELEAHLKEYRDAEQARFGVSRLRDSDVLKALVVLVRIGHSRTSGRPKSRSFVDFVLEEMSENPTAAPGETRSGLIVP